MAFRLPDWAIGVVLSVVAAACLNFGMLLQRLAHRRFDSGSSSSSSIAVYLSRSWVAGMALLAIGSLVDFVALAFVAASIVATLGSVTLLLNVLLSPIVLGERITEQQQYATLIIVTGNVLVVSFASHHSAPMTAAQLGARACESDVLLYTAFALVALVTLTRSVGPLSEPRFSAFVFNDKATQRLQRLVLPCVGGMFGAANMIMARCLSLLLRSAAEGAGINAGATAVVLLGVAACSMLQIHFLNAGLRRFEASRIVPVYQSAMCLWSIVSSMVIFCEYKGQTSIQLLFFSVGVLVTMSGQAAISRDPSTVHETHLPKYHTPSIAMSRRLS